MKNSIFASIVFGVVVVVIILFYSGCNKDSDSIETEGDRLTKSELEIIDAAGIDTVSTFRDALFPDGRNISEWDSLYDSGYVYNFTKNKAILNEGQKKYLFIDRMTKAGNFLVNDQNFSYPSQPNGLAYVFGSKYFANPSKYPGNVCQEPLYGLDCSGMIYQMAIASSLNLIPSGTIDYVNISTWNTAFDNSPDFQGLEMIDLLALPVQQMQAGDIIVGYKKHIGMVFDNGYKLGIFNSLGSPENTCPENMIVKRGPVITKNIPDWWLEIVGPDYHVLRVKSNVSIIDNTTWDATFYYDINQHYWEAEVTFYEDGTTKYDEPDNPGDWLHYGTWLLDEDSIHWCIGVDLLPYYKCAGIITGNTMTGTWWDIDKSWSYTAIKRE